MIAGVATETIVESTRIMKKPRHRANSAGHGCTSGSADGGGGAAAVAAPDGAVWVTDALNTRAVTISPMDDSIAGRDLIAGPPPTLLPADPAADELEAGDDPREAVRRHPESPVAWATLAEQALAAVPDGLHDDVTAYAYARVGYHRSLDLLRRNGWKGHGPVPWEHVPNRGFLRALNALARAADRIGETPERDRCEQLLRDSSPEAWALLHDEGELPSLRG